MVIGIGAETDPAMKGTVMGRAEGPLPVAGQGISTWLPRVTCVPRATHIGVRGAILAPFTNVPLVDSKSSMVNPSASCVSRQWRLETARSRSTTSHSSARPITHEACGLNSS